MPAFTGQLRANEIFAALFNMIISQQINADNIEGTFGELVDSARVDGSLYGDTKLYYDTDALKSHPWLNDAEATNLLAISRPKAPETQAIVLDVFRQIDLTVDNYLSKRAWSTEEAFSTFNGVMLGWLRNTKRIYDSTTYNAYIGTAISLANRAVVEIDLTTALTGLTGEEKNRVEAQTIAESLANLFIDLRDVSRDFNDYKHLKSHAYAKIKVVWNSKWVNKITKLDLPTIFHKDGIVDKFSQDILPARYFGDLLGATADTDYVYDATSNPTGPLTADASNNLTYVPRTNGPKVRSMIEQDIDVSGTVYHVFAGDELPTNAIVYSSTAKLLDAYVENANVIAVLMDERSVPYMSAFEVGTSFFNAKSLTENHYLTWGHNTLEYLKARPFIRLIAK